MAVGRGQHGLRSLRPLVAAPTPVRPNNRPNLALQGEWKVAAAPPSNPASARKLVMRTPRQHASAAANTNKFICEASWVAWGRRDVMYP